MTISWEPATDNSAVTVYRIYRNSTQIAQVSGATRTFTDTDIVPGTQYSYAVRAGDAESNWSSASRPLIVKTLAVSGGVIVEWFVPVERENGDYLELTEIGGYEIRYKLPTQSSYITVRITDGSVDTYDLGYLSGDYKFEIATFDSNGLYSEFVTIAP